MKGYTGKYLRVDLSSGKLAIDHISEGFARKFIGGYGFGARILYDEVDASIDPFDPRNVLSFWTGPLNGTLVPTSGKYAAFAKSPLTNLFGFGISSGSFGMEIKSAGFDGVVISGRSNSPVYLYIEDECAEIRDASHLWGKTTWDTEDELKEECGDVSVASIGPAGEKLVRFANITHDKTRQVGRGGIGAVMGSKNLKAIAVYGTKDVEVHDIDRLFEFSAELYRECQGPATEKYRKYGTPANVLVHNYLGCLPSYNFQRGEFEHAEDVSGERLLKEYVRKIVSCRGCPIACDHLCIGKGKYEGILASVDYQSLAMLGPDCGVWDVDSIIMAINLADRLGVDTKSLGGVIAWAMECYERGILSQNDTDGMNLRFGNGDAVVELTRKIGLREGKFGDLLAEGALRASKVIGKGSEKFVIHCKGQEWGAYSMRTLQTGALGMALSIRGACYLRSGSYQVDVKGEVDRLKLERGRGRIVKEGEDIYAVIDSLIVCKFARGVFTTDRMVEAYRLVTGIEVDAKELLLAGERICNVAKCFNVKCGASRKDDYPPPRAFEPMEEGPHKGVAIRRDEYDMVLDEYYELRGWNRDGIPTKRKLMELGLEKEAGEVGV